MRAWRRSGRSLRAALLLLAVGTAEGGRGGRLRGAEDGKVLAFDNFRCGLGDDDSLRKTISKKSRQGQHLDLLDSLRPLRRTKRRWIIATLELEEEDKGPFPKFIGELFNNKSHDMTIRYLISGPGVDEFPEVGLFSLEDDSSGRVYVHRSIDRETNPSFLVRFDVANTATGEIVDRSLLFSVKIRDINDHAPKFSKKEFNVTVKENHRRDEPVFHVTASDDDEEGTANSRVAYSLVSQTPRPKEPVFSVEPSTGLIRISGCSHYEGPSTFKLLIKATDHGIPQLSSTATINIAIEDSNSHLPVFTKENYQLDVTEGQKEGDILRLNVEDKDTRNTPGWRAKYKIVRGNERGSFIIETDPNTNEGVLSIVKPLVYDSTPGKSLIISVENEEPFFSCDRGQVRSLRVPPRGATVNITVLDTNDAPQFHPPVLVLRREEGVKPGTHLGQYTAKDPDRVPNAIRYQIAFDPAGWVAVEERSGILTTVEILDRESPYVNSSTYTILIHAIDDGVPPQTGTGTAQLFLFDTNDNAPKIVAPFREVCEGTAEGSFRIEAEDKDDFPHAGPFTFHLLEGPENTKDVWKLGRYFGDSAELLMLRSLPVGNYSVPFRILDKQAFSRDQSFYVRVCPCLDGSTCDPEIAYSSAGIGGGAVAAILAAILLLVLGLGLLLWCSCHSDAASKNDFPFIPSEMGNQSLIHYNKESQQVLSQDTPDVRGHISPSTLHSEIRKDMPQTLKEVTRRTSSHSRTSSQVHFEDILPHAKGMIQAKPWGNIDRSYERIALPTRALAEDPNPCWDQRSSYSRSKGMNQKKPRDSTVETVDKMLNQRLHHITCVEDDVIVSCTPLVFAEEGSLGGNESLWSLPFTDDSSLPPDFVDTLGPRFAALSNICKSGFGPPPELEEADGSVVMEHTASAAALEVPPPPPVRRTESGKVPKVAETARWEEMKDL
uniref:cadherin-like protein 26 n=1 Tax=Euleptes europaea TaxID=460621 RepID=UPI0025412758|nr:cadherin-like protein 26 [Euleptes europaea]